MISASLVSLDSPGRLWCLKEKIGRTCLCIHLPINLRQELKKNPRTAGIARMIRLEYGVWTSKFPSPSTHQEFSEISGAPLE
ncbi:hypothetical protein B0H12DRAFT_713262 [Mycena haematopus]|nr:hypothetical protein B0H12DRAFT_713262 [Mycena haematopus]